MARGNGLQTARRGGGRGVTRTSENGSRGRGSAKRGGVNANGNGTVGGVAGGESTGVALARKKSVIRGGANDVPKPPEYLQHLLQTIDEMRARHTQHYGLSIVRLRKMLVDVEDGFLEHEQELERLREEVSGAVEGRKPGEKVKEKETSGDETSEDEDEGTADAESVVAANDTRGVVDLGEESDREIDAESDRESDRESEGLPTLESLVARPSHAPARGNERALDERESRSDTTTLKWNNGVPGPRFTKTTGNLKPPQRQYQTWESYVAADGIATADPQAQAEPPRRKQTARRSRPMMEPKQSAVRRTHADLAAERVAARENTNAAERNISPSQSTTTALSDKENEAPVASSSGRVFEHATDAINSLPPPPMLKLPINPRTFSNGLLAASIGGNQQTFAKVSENMLGKQVFKCHEMIKVNNELHPQAPTTGQHGALVFVHGQEGSGEEGKVYPLFRRTARIDWEYAGEYQVVGRIPMPLHTWQAWTPASKLAIAKKVDHSHWGQKLLLDKGLAADENDLLKMTANDILGFFEKTSEPNLRMSWTLLQCVGYDHAKHDSLAAKQDEEPSNQLQSRRSSISIDRGSSVVALSGPANRPTLVKAKRKSKAIVGDETPERERATPTPTRAKRSVPSSVAVEGQQHTPEPTVVPGTSKRRKVVVESEDDTSEEEEVEGPIKTPTIKQPSWRAKLGASPTGGKKPSAAADTPVRKTAQSRLHPSLTSPTSVVSTEDLSDSHFVVSSRGRRTRKDVDYRIFNKEIDGLIFGDDSDAIVKPKRTGAAGKGDGGGQQGENEEERRKRYDEELEALKGKAFKKRGGKH